MGSSVVSSVPCPHNAPTPAPTALRSAESVTSRRAACYPVFLVSHDYVRLTPSPTWSLGQKITLWNSPVLCPVTLHNFTAVYCRTVPVQLGQLQKCGQVQSTQTQAGERIWPHSREIKKRTCAIRGQRGGIKAIVCKLYTY